MKAHCVVAALVMGALVSRSAVADDKYSCCDLTVRDGACIAQSKPCAQPSSFGVALSDLSSDSAAGWPLPPGDVNASFPAGEDGYVSFTQSAPWLGFCLDAPAGQDPMHEGPTEPIACLTLSMAPGVSAEMATATVPIDPRWDGYQLCYGGPTGPMDGGGGCQSVNAMNDPTISSTPGSGSCCGPAHPLLGNQIVANQEIPGVPPPVLVFGPDGGIVFTYNPDAGDTLAGVPKACLGAFNEPSGCGSPQPDGGGACVPTTCAALHDACGTVADGCGGMLHCPACAARGGSGASSCTAAPGISAEPSTGCGALFAALGLATVGRGLRRRQREPRT
jgi:hypothetical protein